MTPITKRARTLSARGLAIYNIAEIILQVCAVAATCRGLVGLAGVSMLDPCDYLALRQRTMGVGLFERFALAGGQTPHERADNGSRTALLTIVTPAGECRTGARGNQNHSALAIICTSSQRLVRCRIVEVSAPAARNSPARRRVLARPKTVTPTALRVRHPKPVSRMLVMQSAQMKAIEKHGRRWGFPWLEPERRIQPADPRRPRRRSTQLAIASISAAWIDGAAANKSGPSME